MTGRSNEMWLRTGQDITKWVKRRVQTALKGGIILTAHRHAGEGKAGNKKPLASHPKNVSNELTDHIPIHKSQSRNHIQTYNSTGRKRGIAVECFSGRRRPSLTVQWASSVYITWWNPTNGSEIVPCYQNFLLKGEKNSEKVGESYKVWKWERREAVERVGGSREKT